MNLSLPLFHFETWASLVFDLVIVVFLLSAYRRTRMLAFLSLAVGDILFAIQLLLHYVFWLNKIPTKVVLQLSMTGVFLLASIFSTVGIILLCGVNYDRHL